MMKPYVIQLLSSLAAASASLFIPTLAQELGGDATQVGIIIGAYALSMVVSTYTFGRLSDIYSRRRFITSGLALSIFSFLLQTLTDPRFPVHFFANPLVLLVLQILVGFSLGIFPAALTVYVFDSAGVLGRFASLGALGSAVGTLLAGIIAQVTSYYAIFTFSSICFLAAFLVSLSMKKVDGAHLKVPFFPIGLLKRNWHVYVPYVLRHTGANAIWVIFPLFIASLGGDKFWIGVIYTVNTGTQFLVMLFVDRFSSERLIITGLLLSTLTFLSYTLAQNYMQLVPMQVLLAFSWATLYVGALLFLMKNNVEKATSSGILSSVINVSQVIGSLVGGAVAQLFGFHATMYLAAFLSATGLILFGTGSRRRWARL